jgi:ABC-type transporter Mla MlaB component
VQPFSFDLSNFPLVICVASGDLTPDVLTRHFNEYRALLDRDQRYYLIFDASKVGSVDSTARRLYAEFLKANNDDLGRLCIGAAFVITSKVIRGALTAILWLANLPFPMQIVSTRAEALAHIERLKSQ